MQKVMFKIFRFDPKTKNGKLVSYPVPYKKGMRVLDGLRYVQEYIDSTLAFRWNCRAGTCGSCTARVNGKPVLTCKTEVTDKTTDLVVEPLKTLPIVKDLLTNPDEVDTKLNQMKPWFIPKTKGKEISGLYEEQVFDSQEMKRCIHCYACFDVCPVVRAGKDYIGPKTIVNVAAYEMHPKDDGNRMKGLEKNGLWNCIMSGCCSDVCPQNIKIAQNAIPFSKEKSLTIRRKEK